MLSVEIARRFSPSISWSILGGSLVALLFMRHAAWGGAAPPRPPEHQTATLADLIAAARANNPEIRAAEARYQGMRQRPSQEGTLPDPSIGIRYHNERSDRLTFGESDFSFVELSAEQEVPFPGKLGLRATIATREAEREGAMRDATILMVLANVASRYADLAVIDRSRAILDQSFATLGLVVQQANVSYGVGSVVQQDVLRAGLERDALQERLTMLGQRRTAAEAALNALLNRPADDEIATTTLQETPRDLPPFRSLADQLAAQSPDLRVAQETVLKSDAALRLARREYFPDFAFMGSYMNKNGLFPEWELGMRVKVPLYFWRRQRAGVTEAEYAKADAELARRNVHVTAEGRLRELYSMAESSQRLVRLYSGSLIPQASLTLESARASYRVGKVDFLTMLNAFTALLEYRMRYAEETGAAFKAHAEMGPLVGRAPLDW